MDLIICNRFRFGYCKLKDHCQKQHINIMCTNIDQCVDKGCVMRHPKPCKYFERNSCKFDNCAYSHRKYGRDLKIEHLENQVIDLKCEVKELNKNNKECQIEVKNLLQQVTDISNNLKGVIKQIKRDRKLLENDKEKSEAIEKKASDDSKVMQVKEKEYVKEMEDTAETENAN